MVSNPTRSTNRRVKPTLDTKFHIDYSWWEAEGHDLRPYLISHLLPDQRAHFDTNQEFKTVDWIDPLTAEVRRVDALQQALTEAAKDLQYINDHTALVDAIFRVFLANNNEPLSPEELAQRINRQSSTILRTLAGTSGLVYKGIKPVSD